MALYIDIRKTRDGEGWTEYRFDSDGHVGIFRISHEEGAISIVESPPGDKRGALAARAARKVMMVWKTTGKFPEIACWAS